MKQLIDLSVPQCKPFDLPGGDHGVLLIHGFTGSPAHMLKLGELLQAQGFTVKGIRLPGHATKPEDMAAADWRQWIQAAQDGYNALKATCKHVSVAGLSMGGCLTLILAQNNPDIAGIAPISAPMGTKTKGLAFTRILSLFKPEILWGDGNGQQKSILDPYYARGYSGFPTAKGYDLHRIIKEARGHLSRVTCPIAVVQSHADQTITEDSADVILAGVQSPNKQVLWLEDVPHACTASPAHCEQIVAVIAPLFREAAKAQ